MGPDTKLRLLHVCVIQMLRLYLPRHTLRRALGQSLQAGVQNGMAAISNTTAACPSHPSSLRAGSTAQVQSIRALSTTEKRSAKAGGETSKTFRLSPEEERLRSAIAGAPTRAALLALVRREASSTSTSTSTSGPSLSRLFSSGQSTLRWSLGSSLRWLRRFSDLEASSPAPASIPLEVSLLLTHVDRLMEEPQHRLPTSLVHVAVGVCNLKHTGGAREALLGKVVKLYFRARKRASAVSANHSGNLAKLEAAFDTAGYDPGPLMKGLLRKAREAIQTKEEEGEGEVKGKGEEGGREGEGEATRLLPALTSGDASKLIRDMAQLPYRPSHAVVSQALAMLEKGGVGRRGAEDVQLLMEVFARWRTNPEVGLLASLCEGLVDSRLEGWGANELASLLLRLATWQAKPSAELLDLIASRCEEGLGGMEGPAMARLVQGFAKLHHPPGVPLLRLMCLRLGPDVRALDSHVMVDLVSGLAGLTYHPGEEFLQDVANECMERGFAGLRPGELGQLLHALAMCNYRADEAFLESFYRRARELGWGAFNQWSLHLTLWALVAMGVRVEEGLLKAVLCEFHAVIAAGEKGEGGEEWQGRKAVKKGGIGVLRRDVRMYLYLHPQPGKVEEDLEMALQRLAPIVTTKPSAPSPSITQVMLYERLGRRYRVEEEVALAMVDVDMMIHLPRGLKVAVEVDGPTHFFYNDINEPTGKTRLKRRVLDEATRRGTIQSWVWTRANEDWDVEKVRGAIRAAQARGRSALVS